MNHSWNQDCQEKYQQPQICRWDHPNGRKWRGTKKPLDGGERGEWKSGLKTQHSKMKIMIFGPITSWQIGGKQWKQRLIFLGSKVTTDGDWSHEIKRRLLLGRKAMTNVGSVSKSRDITLPRKVCIVKAMIFPMVTHRCEIWTIKNTECWRTDPLNCLAEDYWESLGLQRDQTN